MDEKSKPHIPETNPPDINRDRVKVDIYATNPTKVEIRDSGNQIRDMGSDIYDKELDEILIADIDMKVESREEASKALYIYRRMEREIEEIWTLASRRIADIESWRDLKVGTLRHAQGFFSRPLEFFMRIINRDKPKVKSIAFPEGRIGVRTQQPGIKFLEGKTPEEVWLNPAHRRFVRIKYEWNLSEIRTAILKDGEDLSGFIESIDEQEAKFYIKLAEGS